jgi:hypothetical protein
MVSGYFRGQRDNQPTIKYTTSPHIDQDHEQKPYTRYWSWFAPGNHYRQFIMLLVPRQTKEPLTAPLSQPLPGPEPSTEPAVTPVQFQDDELASDIIRTSSSLDTMMKLVQSRIDEGDLIPAAGGPVPHKSRRSGKR